MDDYRNMSIDEAIRWGCAPGMDDGEREARRSRWERRKQRKDRRK